MGRSILTTMVLVMLDLLSSDSVLEGILMPSASPAATPMERVLDPLPERLPSRIR